MHSSLSTSSSSRSLERTCQCIYGSRYCLSYF
nr:MAG TPA: hypothetical protein [Caudoviricetes sp.]DAP79174.1 MAG TPA: hypothetical protein [Caudoviricetes sp.]